MQGSNEVVLNSCTNKKWYTKENNLKIHDIIVKENTKEFHIPFHNYAGPGTHVLERLNNNRRPTNDLDYASLIHDIEYMNPNITKKQADDNMINNLKKTKHPMVALGASVLLKLFNKMGSKENDKEKYLLAKNMALNKGYINKHMSFINS